MATNSWYPSRRDFLKQASVFADIRRRSSPGRGANGS
jgi:hypothetical protein